MASIQKTGSGKWAVRWRFPPGREGRARQHTCPTRRSAELVRRAVEESLAQGKDWRPLADYHRRVLLSRIVAEHLTDYARLVSPKTLAQRAVTLRGFLRWLEQTGHGHEPAIMSRQLLAEYHAWLQTDRDQVVGGNSPAGTTRTVRASLATANRWVRMVEACWNWAYDSDQFGELVPRPRKLQVRQAPGRRRAPAPTWAQMDAVIQAARGRADGYARLFTVSRCTGLRLRQALALDWDDVDLEAGTLRVRPELGKSKSERSGRVVPLAPALVHELAGWGRRDGHLVEWHREPRRVVYPLLHRLWADAGVPEEVWRARPTHAFRRGFMSGLIGAGVRKPVVQRLVGHRGDVTEESYIDQRARWAQMLEAVAQVPELGAGDGHLVALDQRRRSGSQ